MHLRTIGVCALLALSAVAASAETFTWTFQDRYVTAGTPFQGNAVSASGFNPFTASVTAGGGAPTAFANQSSTLGTSQLSYSGGSRAMTQGSVGRSNLRVRFSIADATAWSVYGSLNTGNVAGAQLLLRPLAAR